jgi:hypothetical protein
MMLSMLMTATRLLLTPSRTPAISPLPPLMVLLLNLLALPLLHLGTRRLLPTMRNKTLVLVGRLKTKQ